MCLGRVRCLNNFLCAAMRASCCVQAFRVLTGRAFSQAPLVHDARGGGGAGGKEQYYQSRQGVGDSREDFLSNLRKGFQNALGDVMGSIERDGRPEGPRSARGSPSNDVSLLSNRRENEEKEIVQSML